MTFPVYYMPTLHPERLPIDLPPHVVFFPVGLEKPSVDGKRELSPGSSASMQDSVATQASTDALPLSPVEARLVLEEMLRMGEEYAAAGMLKELAAHQFMSLQQKDRGRPGEFDALSRFVESDGAAEAQQAHVTDWSAASREANLASSAAIRQALVDCQKTLLLAYSLEERAGELDALEKRHKSVEKALLASLGDGDGPPATPEPDDTDIGAVLESELPWRLMVDAAIPFLPEQAILFTADPAMTSDLREAGMLQPLPEDRLAYCRDWPPSLVAGLLHAEVPAWRLVGRRGPLPERPWLKREIEVLVARPVNGWAS